MCDIVILIQSVTTKTFLNNSVREEAKVLNCPGYDMSYNYDVEKSIYVSK